MVCGMHPVFDIFGRMYTGITRLLKLRDGVPYSKNSYNSAFNVSYQNPKYPLLLLNTKINRFEDGPMIWKNLFPQ